MSSLKGRVKTLEALAGVGSGVATVWLHFGANLPAVRRVAGDRIVYSCGVRGDSPFKRPHVLPRRSTLEADRRPGELTPARLAVVRGRLAPFLDGRQRKLVAEAAFVIVA